MTFTAALAGQAPPSNVIAVNFGAKTLKGLGEAPLGYGGGGSVTITAGNTGSIWAINSRNNLVAAGTFGAAAPAYSGPYSLTVTDGASFTKTVNVTIVANAFHAAWVASGTNADSPTGTNQITTVLGSSTVNLGDTIYCRDGHYNPTNARMVLSRAVFAGAWTGSNPVLVTSENIGCAGQGGLASDPRGIAWTHGGQAIFGYFEFQFTGSNAYLKFQYLTVTNDGAGGTFIYGLTSLSAASKFVTVDSCFLYGNQNITYTNCQFQGSSTGTTLTVSSIINGSMAVGQDIFDASGSAAFGWSPTQYTILSQLTGPAGGVGTYQLSTSLSSGSVRINSGVLDVPYPGGGLLAGPSSSDWTVTNNEFFGIDRPVQVIGPNNVVNNNTFHQITQDCIDFEDWWNGTCNWNFMYDKLYDPQNQNHGDFIQCFNVSLNSGTLQGLVAIGNIMVRGVGMAGCNDGQGIFHSDDNGVTYTGVELAGNIACCTESNTYYVTGGNAPVIKFNTGIMDQTANLPGNSGTQNVDVHLSSGGIGEYNAISGSLVGTFATNTGNKTGLTASAAYTAPGNAETTLNTVAGVLAAFSAKAGGPLDPAISGNPFWAGADHYVDFINRTTSFPV